LYLPIVLPTHSIPAAEFLDPLAGSVSELCTNVVSNAFEGLFWDADSGCDSFLVIVLAK
jgi:hypothetical protein